MNGGSSQVAMGGSGEGRGGGYMLLCTPVRGEERQRLGEVEREWREDKGKWEEERIER